MNLASLDIYLLALTRRLNMLVAAAFCCTIMIFAMIELTNILSFVANTTFIPLDYVSVEMAFKVSISYFPVTTLQASLLTTNMSELGS